MADRLAQGFMGLIQSHIIPPPVPWPNPPTQNPFEVDFSAQNFIKKDFGLALDNSRINGVTSIFDIIGNRIGQAGLDFRACLNSVVQQFFRRLPVPFHHDENTGMSIGPSSNSLNKNVGITLEEDLESIAEWFKDYRFPENGTAVIEGLTEDEIFGVNVKALKHLGRSQVCKVLPFVEDIRCTIHDILKLWANESTIVCSFPNL